MRGRWPLQPLGWHALQPGSPGDGRFLEPGSEWVARRLCAPEDSLTPEKNEVLFNVCVRLKATGTSGPLYQPMILQAFPAEIEIDYKMHRLQLINNSDSLYEF